MDRNEPLAQDARASSMTFLLASNYGNICGHACAPERRARNRSGEGKHFGVHARDTDKSTSFSMQRIKI